MSVATGAKPPKDPPRRGLSAEHTSLEKLVARVLAIENGAEKSRP